MVVSAVSPAFQVEVAVIGAGVVGLAIARSLAKVGKEVLILDRASTICSETSSRNSEVIHAGLYYPSNSLKSKFCVNGKKQLLDYCMERHIPMNQCGKLIVATNTNQYKNELPKIKQKANLNGVLDVRIITKDDVMYLEPDLNCNGALLSPSTAVFDSHTYCLNLLADAEQYGATLALNTTIIDARIDKNNNNNNNNNTTNKSIQLCAMDGTWFQCNSVINSAGLWSSDIARLFHNNNDSHNNNMWKPPNQYFAKGTYFRLEGKRPSFEHLIYPIPEPGGLGVHATIDWSSNKSIKFGPDVEWINPKTMNGINTIDLNPNPKRSQKFYKQIRKYWPNLEDNKLVPDYVGIRPKLQHPSIIIDNNQTNDDDDDDDDDINKHDCSSSSLSKSKNNKLPFMDFSIVGPKDHGIPGLVHLFGIESPGLTSSMAIGDYIRTLLFEN